LQVRPKFSVKEMTRRMFGQEKLNFRGKLLSLSIAIVLMHIPCVRRKPLVEVVE